MSANVKSPFKRGERPAALQNTRKWAFWLVVAAVVLRLGFVVFFQEIGRNTLLDSERYRSVARCLLAGKGFSEYGRLPTAFVPPLYPLFLAGSFKVFGPHDLPVQLLQVLFGALVPLLVFQMGVSAFGARAGLLAALAAAVQPELVAMSGYLYTETLFMFFSTAFLAFLWKGMEGGWNRDWALAGLWLGLSVSTRSLLFFFPPFLVGLFLVFRDLRRFAGRALWMSAVAGAVLVPWTVRNALAFHEFIPVSTGGGAEFWVGADIPNQGRYRYAETRNRILKLTENAPSEPEANRILIRQGLRNIAEDPWGWIRVCMLKAARFLVEVYENVPSGQSRQPNRAVTFVLVLGYYPLMILGLAGMWAARRIPRFLVPVSGFMLYTWILASLTLFVPRYRIPVLPLWCLFAGLCMDRVISVLQRRRNPEF